MIFRPWIYQEKYLVMNSFFIKDINFLPNGKMLAVSTTDGIQLLDIANMSWMSNLRFILSLGYSYSITAEGDNLNFRMQPSVNGEIIKKLNAGEWFGVVDGPVFSDGYIWWKVKTEEDIEGWIVEMPGWESKGGRPSTPNHQNELTQT